MKKPIYTRWWFIAIVVILILAVIGSMMEEEPATNEKDSAEVSNEKKDTNKEETPKDDEKENAVDLDAANDTSVPLTQRVEKIATDLFGTKTTDGSDRNITVDSMGDAIFLKMMIDDGVTMDNTLNLAQRHTIELLEVLKDVEDLQNITINWQGNFKDSAGNSSVGSALAVGVKKEELDKINFEELRPEDLKDAVSNYGTHDSFK